MADYVRALEETRDTADLPEASGEAIAREFERYLERRDSRLSTACRRAVRDAGSMAPEGVSHTAHRDGVLATRRSSGA